MTTVQLTIITLAVLGLLCLAWLNRPRKLKLSAALLVGRVGAVLQTLAHHTAYTATNGNQQLVASGARVLLGCALAEAAGTPGAAKIRLRDGTSVNAPVLFIVTFAASGSMDTFFPDEGVEVTSGAIFLEAVSGTTEGVVYWG